MSGRGTLAVRNTREERANRGDNMIVLSALSGTLDTFRAERVTRATRAI